MRLDPAWEAMAQTGRLGEWSVRFLAETTSTNDVAWALAQEGAAAGSVVVAEQQSQGRGRLARPWLSPPGVGLYCSLILRPRLAPAELAKLTLGAGLAASRAVEVLTGEGPMLKWPNDLWLADRKVGGILAESRLAAGTAVVILGLGINVNSGPEVFPSELREKVTSLAGHFGREFVRSSLLAVVLAEIAAMVSRSEREGFAGILADWRKRDATLGRELEWLTPAGQVVRGLSLGPDGEGLLRIRDGAGLVHEVLSGDIALAGRRTE